MRINSVNSKNFQLASVVSLLSFVVNRRSLVASVVGCLSLVMMLVAPLAQAAVIGRFPSLLGSDGARAVDTDIVWLGEERDKENNSKQTDADSDDGVSAEFNSCAASRAYFMVHVKNPGKTSGVAYLNLWADWNRDGQWAGSDKCAAEWAVKNYEINLSKQTGDIWVYAPEFIAGENAENIWYRTVVSYNEKLIREDGGGEFSAGEVEDYGPLPILSLQKDPAEWLPRGAKKDYGLACVPQPILLNHGQSVEFTVVPDIKEAEKPVSTGFSPKNPGLNAGGTSINSSERDVTKKPKNPNQFGDPSNPFVYTSKEVHEIGELTRDSVIIQATYADGKTSEVSCMVFIWHPPGELPGPGPKVGQPIPAPDGGFAPKPNPFIEIWKKIKDTIVDVGGSIGGFVKKIGEQISDAAKQIIGGLGGPGDEGQPGGAADDDGEDVIVGDVPSDVPSVSCIEKTIKHGESTAYDLSFDNPLDDLGDRVGVIKMDLVGGNTETSPRDFVQPNGDRVPGVRKKSTLATGQGEATTITYNDQGTYSAGDAITYTSTQVDGPKRTTEDKFKINVAFRAWRTETVAGKLVDVSPSSPVTQEVTCKVNILHDEPTTPTHDSRLSNVPPTPTPSGGDTPQVPAPQPVPPTETLNVWQRIVAWFEPAPEEEEDIVDSGEADVSCETVTIKHGEATTIGPGQEADIRVAKPGWYFDSMYFPRWSRPALKNNQRTLIMVPDKDVTSSATDITYQSTAIDGPPRSVSEDLDLVVVYASDVPLESGGKAPNRTQEVTCTIIVEHDEVPTTPTHDTQQSRVTETPSGGKPGEDLKQPAPQPVPPTETLNVWQRIVAWFDEKIGGQGGGAGEGGEVITEPGGVAPTPPPAGGPAGPVCYNTPAEKKAMEEACDATRTGCINDAGTVMAACNAKAVQDVTDAVNSSDPYKDFNAGACRNACVSSTNTGDALNQCNAGCDAKEQARKDAIQKGVEGRQAECGTKYNADLDKCTEDWQKCRNAIKECPPPAPEPAPTPSGDGVALKRPAPQPVPSTRTSDVFWGVVDYVREGDIFSIPPLLQVIGEPIVGETVTRVILCLVNDPACDDADAVGADVDNDRVGPAITRLGESIKRGVICLSNDPACDDAEAGVERIAQRVPEPGPVNFTNARRLRELIFGVKPVDPGDASAEDVLSVLPRKLVEIVLPAPELVFTLPSPTQELERITPIISPFNFLSNRLVDLSRILRGLAVPEVTSPTSDVPASPRCFVGILADANPQNLYQYEAECSNYKNCSFEIRNLTSTGALINRKSFDLPKTVPLVNSDYIPSAAAIAALQVTCDGATYSAFAHNYRVGRDPSSVSPLGSGPRLTIAAGALTSGTENVAYTTTLTAIGGSIPYTWEVYSGSLPTGLSLGSATGIISGTPTADGTYNFSIRALGADSRPSDDVAYSIAIAAAADPLTITTTSPLANAIGTNCTAIAVFTATGGTAPYTWSLSNLNAVATGNSVAVTAATGQETCTIVGSGTATFTITVTDAVLDTDTLNAQQQMIFVP